MSQQRKNPSRLKKVGSQKVIADKRVPIVISGEEEHKTDEWGEISNKPGVVILETIRYAEGS